MNGAVVVVELYGLLVIITVVLHEFLHFISAKLLGYKTKLILCGRGIGIYVPDVHDKTRALFVLLAPQLLTVMYLVIAVLTTGIGQVVSVLLALINFTSSYYDFKEARTFIVVRRR